MRHMLALLLAGAALAEPREIAVHRDLRYAEIEGVAARFLSLDLYTARGSRGRPVLVMVHGGGWRAGDKASRGVVQPKARFLVGKGYLFASVNYRLSPTVKHPAHVQDVARALLWLKENVARYGGDPERVFLMGHSAGAHLAALVATDERYLRDLSLIKGVVLLDSAAYDIPRLLREFPRSPAMFDAAFGAGEESRRDASPITHVAKGKNIPPVLAFHTGRRRDAAILTKAFVAALTKAGVKAYALHAPDDDHGSINRDLGREGDLQTAQVMQFLEYVSTR